MTFLKQGARDGAKGGSNPFITCEKRKRAGIFSINVRTIASLREVPLFLRSRFRGREIWGGGDSSSQRNAPGNDSIKGMLGAGRDPSVREAHQQH